ncbi:MAG: vanadium-dependent haloperoxidase [Saprospiraceae bacterium]|nr:vanadium-dependent haloperoxidase [Saprospiraceae bacterium]
MKKLSLSLKLCFWLIISGFVLLVSCRKDNVTDPNTTQLPTNEFSAEVPLTWYQLMLEIDRFSPGYRPPAAARMMAYVGMAAYESVLPGMPEYKSLRTVYPNLNLPVIDQSASYYWPACANAAFSTSFKLFYPHIKSSDYIKIDQLEAKFENQFLLEQAEDVLKRSKTFGKLVAEEVYRYSATDLAGHEAYKNPRPSSYVPPAVGPNGEKLWQPTFPDFTRALFPYWGQVRPFALSQSELIAKPPIPYSEDPNSRFFQQATETKLLAQNASFEDRWIAEFWSDDIFELTFEPAARQVAIANQMVIADKISLDKAVELYAKLGMAMADASIAVWNSKYIYNVIRPIDYIRRLMDPSWTTILNAPYANIKSLTPEFPAYPSGHACFAGSAASILTDIFGNNRSFTDNCHVHRFEFIGAPRYYSSFHEAAAENGYSRLPLGVHFRMDSDEGLRIGYYAGKKVLELPWRK